MDGCLECREMRVYVGVCHEYRWVFVRSVNGCVLGLYMGVLLGV